MWTNLLETVVLVLDRATLLGIVQNALSTLHLASSCVLDFHFWRSEHTLRAIAGATKEYWRTQERTPTHPEGDSRRH